MNAGNEGVVFNTDKSTEIGLFSWLVFPKHSGKVFGVSHFLTSRRQLPVVTCVHSRTSAASRYLCHRDGHFTGKRAGSNVIINPIAQMTSARLQYGHTACASFRTPDVITASLIIQRFIDCLSGGRGISSQTWVWPGKQCFIKADLLSAQHLGSFLLGLIIFLYTYCFIIDIHISKEAS